MYSVHSKPILAPHLVPHIVMQTVPVPVGHLSDTGPCMFLLKGVVPSFKIAPQTAAHTESALNALDRHIE
jgi:hypothetical protein